MADPIVSHLTAGGYLKKRKILVNNFIGGLAWGVGSVLGATVVVAILIAILRFFNFIPGITDLTNTIDRNTIKMQEIREIRETR
jgi:hypothetical protein